MQGNPISPKDIAFAYTLCVEKTLRGVVLVKVLDQLRGIRGPSHLRVGKCVRGGTNSHRAHTFKNLGTN